VVVRGLAAVRDRVVVRAASEQRARADCRAHPEEPRGQRGLSGRVVCKALSGQAESKAFRGLAGLVVRVVCKALAAQVDCRALAARAERQGLAGYKVPAAQVATKVQVALQVPAAYKVQVATKALADRVEKQDQAARVGCKDQVDPADFKARADQVEKQAQADPAD
jgi:hypothetical protein